MLPEEIPSVYSVDDDAARAARLLEWARRNGFRIGPMLVVGTIQMQVADIRQEKVDGPSVPEPVRSVEEEFELAHQRDDRD